MADEINYSKGSQKIIYGFFALVGAVIILGCLAWSLAIKRFINRASAVKGTVAALEAGGSHPKIKFTTAQGKEIEYSQNGLIFGYQVGDEAAVLYDPQNPRDASVNTFGALWGFNLSGFILGICFLGIGCFKFLNSR